MLDIVEFTDVQLARMKTGIDHESNRIASDI